MRDEVINAFRGRIRPVAVPALYRVGLVVVALAMVALPLVYVALVAAVGYGVYYHAFYDRTLFSVVREVRTAVLAYFGPLFAGLVLLFFMVKPLLARPPKAVEARALEQSDEPLLFEFVDTVCQAVGSPRPRRIDVDTQVNASASFRRGLRSFAGSDLVLTLGMPLVAGLTVAQLAGVLAHEFGHFSQSAGLRLTYVIRLVNRWFHRVVFERDRWDARIEAAARTSGSGYAGAFIGLARAMVWLTRRILWGLMWVGTAVSCFMLRQMEFDADRHGARLVGADVFETTHREIAWLSVAHNKALADLQSSWREGRLADSVPALVAANRRRLPVDLMTQVARSQDESRTGLFDTHPADSDRLASARREADPALFHCASPATMLFRDFSALAREVTTGFYEQVLDQHIGSEQLMPVETFVARDEEADRHARSRDRYFCGAAHLELGIPVPECIPTEPADATALSIRLHEIRENLARGREKFQANLDAFGRAENRQRLAILGRSLAMADVTYSAEKTGLPPAEHLTDEEEGAAREMAEIEGRLGAHHHLAGMRLTAALEVLALPGLGDRDPETWALRETLSPLLPAAHHLGQALPRLRALRHQHARLSVLGPALPANQGNQLLVAEFERAAGQIVLHWNSVLAALGNVAYPFEHSFVGISVSAYLAPNPAAASDPGALFNGARECLQRAYELHMRLLGHLAVAGERLEAVLGLEPLES